ncbi:COG1470 family protein [Arcticibacter tournemirensis]
MSVFTTRARAKRIYTCLFILLLAVTTGSSRCLAQSVTLYTPYTKISVPPGESIGYDIDVINKGRAVSNAAISVAGLPKGWSYTLKSGGWTVGQVSVLPNDKKTLSLQVQVPLQVNKGTYHFMVVAKGAGRLPLTVVVSQQGTFKSEFTTAQSNMQGAANSTFTYTATLRNGTGADQVYALNANVPPGWNVAFKADYKEVSSVSVEANKTKELTIEVDPPDQAAAGDYKIPVIAATNATSANLELDLVIKGSYALQLSTPNGLLSTSTTAGDEKRVELTVNNTGSAMLKKVELQAAAPTNWEVSFEPKNIENLGPGGTAQAFAIIKADKKAIAGDYVVGLEAKTPEISSKADFRVAVETSLLSGWLGLFIILLALGGVYYLFRKYGRR